MGVARGGDLHAELAYGNHPSVASHELAIQKKVCSDVVNGVLVVRGGPVVLVRDEDCLLYTSPSPRDRTRSRMPSSA